MPLLNFRQLINDAKALKESLTSRPEPAETQAPSDPQSLMARVQPFMDVLSKFKKKSQAKDNELFLKERKPSQDAEVSAYTASVSETDERPRETKRQTQVKEGRTIATNNPALLNKKVKIDNVIYVIEDLMGPRFRKLFNETGKVMFDIFMEDKKKAKEFGRQKLPFDILD